MPTPSPAHVPRLRLLAAPFASFSIVSSPLPHLPRISTLVPPNEPLSYPSSPSPGLLSMIHRQKIGPLSTRAPGNPHSHFPSPIRESRPLPRSGTPSLSARLLIVGVASSSRGGVRRREWGTAVRSNSRRLVSLQNPVGLMQCLRQAERRAGNVPNDVLSALSVPSQDGRQP